MKQIIKIVFLLISLFGTVSCVDMLNPEPENSVTFYNFFKTEEDVASAVYGIHALYRGMFDGYPVFEGSGELADHVKSSDDDLRGFRNLDGTLITNDRYFLSWKGWYNIITQALIVIENIDRANLPKERHDNYLGQALFFKAMAYFKIVQAWGDCPYVSVSYELKERGRESWKTVLDKEILEAERAALLLKPWRELIDNKSSAITSRQIPGREAVYALLTHMYAWKGSLCDDMDAVQKGIDAATYVIKKGGFSLAKTPEEVCTKVMMGKHPECIFEVELLWSEVWLQGYYHMESLYEGYPIVPYTPVGDIINNTLHINASRVLEMYPTRVIDGETITDLRREAYFYKPAEMIDSVDSKGWAFLQKRREVVLDKTSSPTKPETWFRNFDGNVIVYRLADIVLLRAELYAKKGDTQPAIDDLNEIRGRALAKEYSADEGDLYYAIFKEREKELIAERHRRYDIVRTGFYGELSDAWQKLTPQDVEDGAVYLPVHVAAFYDNSYMRQNRFWAKQW
ncbi:RagB/SusD family nutrient uptake outer membrane protein [Sanguibacteroides justesenii]|uniref:Uncharacterized protein n=1 Tax=Sanguibacteroides justesenii TaxID=1547597 RepID=A0A0C3MEF8_9PORP|nr:RagB/SusD family nutrient uptake outer membrane protein [Sanguibacteroides justesenii]KIO43113.1 hypothetical protein IE90_12935 [Sanguibacteroides justesenii]KIO44828.1 hypothetical protein BA92_07335 [Sanguibacteroides justesenii]PXZ43042.1 RagB/SusD family nutrient uptake outer membrane protein [Sanguibacteroides justesenii]